MKELTGSFEHQVLAQISNSFGQEVLVGLIIAGFTIMAGILSFFLKRLWKKVDKNDIEITNMTKEQKNYDNLIESYKGLVEDYKELVSDLDSIKESMHSIETEQAVQKESYKNINDKLDILLNFNTDYKKEIDDKINKLHARVTRVQGAD